MFMLLLALILYAILADVLIFLEGLQDVGDGSCKLAVLVSVGRVVPVHGLGGRAPALAAAGCVNLLKDANAVRATLSPLRRGLVGLLEVVREILIGKA
jgi:hypothetical protein